VPGRGRPIRHSQGTQARSSLPVSSIAAGGTTSGASRRSTDGTWAVLLDRRDHALGLLSGGASADGVEEVERFRCLWNLECPPASEMLAEAEARFAAERSSRK
jgi:hypothetical protein